MERRSPATVAEVFTPLQLAAYEEWRDDAEAYLKDRIGRAPANRDTEEQQ